jgi:hypothetical protein
MRLSAVFCVTTLLTLGVVATPVWATTSDDANTDVAASAEPARPGFDPDDSDMTGPSPQGLPVAADSDCLVVLRNTALYDAEQEIDPGASLSWIATDGERETPGKCRDIGARCRSSPHSGGA